MRMTLCLLLAATGCSGGSLLDADPSAAPGAAGKADDPRAERLDALVVLAERTDLQKPRALPTREERGRAVYDALRATAERTQAPLLAHLASERIAHRRFYVSNLVAVRGVTRPQLAAIARLPGVHHVASDSPRRILPPASATAPEVTRVVASIGKNLVRIGADRVWSEFGATGQGIVVAGQDSGVEWTHPALRGKYRGGAAGAVAHDYSWHDAIARPVGGGPGTSRCGYDNAAPCDDHGHGTHTMGTIVGDDGAGNQIGVAPGAQWIACRNMDDGAGRPSTYIECFEWFLAPYPQGQDAMRAGVPSLAPHVINNSWGCPASEECSGSEMRPVLEALSAAGVYVVASAGNEGPGCATIGDQPAWISDLTLSVGAFDHRNDAIAGFSSRGPSALDGLVGPDLVAPGVSIRSSVPGGGYESGAWSGTSMAGPHVVGVVALLWSADATLRGRLDETTLLLRATSQPKTTGESCGGVAGSAIPNNTFGHGIVDAHAAVRARVRPDIKGASHPLAR